MPILNRVRATLRRYDLTAADSRILVALSGGPDSVALVRVLQSLDPEGIGQLVGLAHLDHRLREGSAEDARFCRDLAQAWQLPIVIESCDVQARARQRRQSIEAAAHDARYEFLATAAARLGADRIALGHTRDDQAETVLLRLMRGAGARGLAGMHPRRGPVIRPLLDCRRRELRTYLDEMGQPYLHDPTNDDVQIGRNRVRAELLPMLERRFNPRIVDALADQADLAREDWDWLEAEAQRLLDAICREETRSEVVLDAQGLLRTPTAVGRAALLLALERMAVRGRIRMRHVLAALDLARSGAGAVDLPGVRLQRIGPDLVLSSSSRAGRRGPGSGGTNFFCYRLSIPGEVRVAEARCTIAAQARPFSEGMRALFRDRQTAVLAADGGLEQLFVRNRRPGDRFRPFGLRGHKKLQDYFVDRKVPREERDRIPLVVDDGDRIVWVAGHEPAGDFRVTGAAQPVIILRLSLWGGPA